MRILGIETSCDETSVAIVLDGKIIEHHHIYSQTKEHGQFMGVVPELASRLHYEKLFDMVHYALLKTNFSWSDIDAIAVTQEPGLLGSLLLGFTTAKTLAYLTHKPLIPVNHLWGHLYAPFLETEAVPFPYGGAIVSGGHTLLALVESYNKVTIIGSTIDDSLGECYDKVAKMLNLGYPGGPVVDKYAEEFSKTVGSDYSFSYHLPTVHLKNEKDKYIFSYSGIKTAVRRIIEKESENLNILELCYIFQQKAIEQLLSKIEVFIKDYNFKNFVVAGGVACNSELRLQLKNIKDCQIHIPSPILCTDNAAMIAGLANFLKPLTPEEYIHLDVKDKFLSFKEKQSLRG